MEEDSNIYYNAMPRILDDILKPGISGLRKKFQRNKEAKTAVLFYLEMVQVIDS